MSARSNEARLLRRHLRDLLTHRDALVKAIALLEESERHRPHPVHRARRLQHKGGAPKDGAAH